MANVTREQSPIFSGTYLTNLGQLGTAPYYVDRRIITEDKGPGDGRSLLIDHGLVIKNGMLRNGRYTKSGIPTQIDFSNWSVDYFRDPLAGGGRFQHIALPGEPTNMAVLATQLLARTNPSRPVVDLPVFLLELRELPSLIFSRGTSYLKAIAKGQLTWEFAIRPLVADLNGLLDIHDFINRRVVELNALAQGGISRTRTFWEDSGTYNFGNIATASSPTYAASRHDKVVSSYTKFSGHVKWFPAPDFPNSPIDVYNLARRAVLGLTIDSYTAWNAIPWTWLIDWFSSFGDYLLSVRNTVPCFPSTPEIMVYRKSEFSFYKTVDASGLLPKEHQTVRITKTRTKVASTATAYMPFLSRRQVSILASLVALRRRNRIMPATTN